MATTLRAQEWERIREHGAQAYPNECCGVLLGKEQDGRKMILEVLPLQNAWEDSEINPYEVKPEDSTRNRFLIEPKDYLRIDREARGKGMDIIGFYHSHPDHPARPSEFDRKHALRGFTYVILAVEKGVPRQITAWSLNEDQTQFVPEEMTISDGEDDKS